MYVERITGPTAELVTLAEAKAHLRVVTTDEESVITMLITAAREFCEDVARRSFVSQTFELSLDAWPISPLTLPLQPTSSITSIKYVDSDGTTQTVDPTVYRLDGGKVFPASGKNWPSASLQPYGAIKVRYVAGYGNAAAVPAKYKQAVLLTLAHWFQNREAIVVGESVKELPLAVQALLLTDRGY